MAEKFMTLDPQEILNDGKTVGILNGFDPAPGTVTYHDEESTFQLKANDSLVGDDDSTLFVASDGGELSIDYGPQFDAPVVSNLKRRQLKTALSALRKAGDSYTAGPFAVHFDHAGPIVFEGDVMVATTPLRFPWDFGSPERAPSGPSGPSIGGAADAE